MTAICNSRARRAAVHGILASTLALGALVSISVIPAWAITPGVCSDSAGVDCVTATTAAGTAAIGSVPSDISLGTTVAPGSTVSGVAVGATAFIDTAPTSSQTLTLAMTDLCTASCAKELAYTNISIVKTSLAVTASNSSPCVGTNNVGTATAGSGTTTLSGGEANGAGATLSSAVTLETGTASVAGCWSATGATITAEIPANLTSVSSLTATIQYTLTA